ncbi:MAG: hypothetical protein ACPHO4_14035 [Longimicrobiales bacterium]|jgi:hypothetical protein
MNQDARSTRLFAALALLGVIVLGGCEGANLFQAQIGTSDNGPTATITSLSDGETVGLNSSLGVGFDLDAPDGAASFTVLGRYTGAGDEAYVSVTDALDATATSGFATMSPAAGQVAGEVYVVVEIADVDGDTGRDSVRVTITN